MDTAHSDRAKADELVERAQRAIANSRQIIETRRVAHSDDKPSPRGLRETEIAIRNVMPAESTIDLDLHARAIAVAAVCARRRARTHRTG